MFFSDYRFVVVVAVAIGLSWVKAGRLRNAAVFASAVAWLTWSYPQALAALIALTLGVVYPAARIASALRPRAPRRAHWIGVLAAGGLIAITIALRFGASPQPVWESASAPGRSGLACWIGASYFALRALHVLVETAHGCVAMPSLTTLLQYMLFLPTLIAGPLFRLDSFAAALSTTRPPSWPAVCAGVLRIARGVAKQALAVPVLASWAVGLHGHGLVLEPAAYAVSYVMLYLALSGYADLAIGIGRLFGFIVPEDFKRPFTATTMTQFWRNWQVTLCDWLRVYVVIPLGGMRATGARLAATVLCATVIAGMWNGILWIDLWWGLYHGILLLIERWLHIRPLHGGRAPRWRVALRYAIVQINAIGGMFIFLDRPPR